MPSPGVMMLLLAAGRELQRAGGSTAGSTALEVLEWDLGAATLRAFQLGPLLLEPVCLRISSFAVTNARLCAQVSPSHITLRCLTVGSQVPVRWTCCQRAVVQGLMCHCRASLEPGTALEQRISEKGVLQLLFDIRFLRDVLAGGKPPADATTSDAAQDAAVAQRKAAFAELESGLQVTPASGILSQGGQTPFVS